MDSDLWCSSSLSRRGAGSFVVDGAEVLKGGMSSDGVVEAVDVGRDGVVCLGAGGEVLAAEALLLDGGEETLGHGIVGKSSPAPVLS